MCRSIPCDTIKRRCVVRPAFVAFGHCRRSLCGQIEDATGNLVDELWLVKPEGSRSPPASAEAQPTQPRRASAADQARIYKRTHACQSAATRLPECAAL
jgi:hypothetical protein